MGYRKIDPFLDRLEDSSRRGKKARSEPNERKGAMTARVLVNHGTKCLIVIDGAEPIVVPVSRKLAAAAGDLVHTDGERVLDILPRGKVFARADASATQVIAANVDRVVLVQSAESPPFREGLTDRYRVFSAIMDLPLILALNKIDAGVADVIARARAQAAPGLDVILVSAATGDGIERLAELVREGISVFSGHSGVGKSSLLRRLAPDAEIAVGAMNTQTERGRQTTTAVTAYRRGGALIIDTPGIRQFSFIGATPRDVARAFPDIEDIALACRYADCLHNTEPGCAVKDAVDAGALGRERFDSYRRVILSLTASKKG